MFVAASRFSRVKPSSRKTRLPANSGQLGGSSAPSGAESPRMAAVRTATTSLPIFIRDLGQAIVRRDSGRARSWMGVGGPPHPATFMGTGVGSRIMDRQTFERGVWKFRKSVLSVRDLIENALKSADDFNRPLRELVTGCQCWGAVWGREELSRT